MISKSRKRLISWSVTNFLFRDLYFQNFLISRSVFSIFFLSGDLYFQRFLFSWFAVSKLSWSTIPFFKKDLPINVPTPPDPQGWFWRFFFCFLYEVAMVFRVWKQFFFKNPILSWYFFNNLWKNTLLPAKFLKFKFFLQKNIKVQGSFEK